MTTTNGAPRITPGPPALWTVDQVAAHLSMSKQWIYKQAELGKLPCHRLGASLRFRPEEVQAYLESTRHGPRVRPITQLPVVPLR